jgi:hypothetical protein
MKTEERAVPKVTLVELIEKQLALSGKIRVLNGLPKTEKKEKKELLETLRNQLIAVEKQLKSKCYLS